ncbi:MAG: sulfatase-like hydrolase/transferase [Rhodobacteraceae bacterium]|jgi:arylsulfatase A-like enzyme|nr:sulfatase-like hydrolase/transferase [Paracoccaceae bacterium]
MQDRPRNVVLIMTDQQRADSLGCLGHPAVRTPHLDRLAARGAVMRNHITPHQICAPSRGTLFSGLYARHHGLTRNGIALPPDLPLLSHLLQAAGRRTHGVGKFHFQPILAAADLQMPESNAFWATPAAEGWRGPFYGFDSVDLVIGESVESTVGGHYARWLSDRAPGAAALYAPENALAPPPPDLEEVWKSAIPEALHYNTWIGERACAFLDGTGGDPFFLLVSFPDPHHPFSPPRPWCDMYDPADMPPPRAEPGELDAMPGYLRAGDEAGKSYVDYLRDPGPPREQGFMMPTRQISARSLSMAMAHTCGMISMIDAVAGRILGRLNDLGLTEDTLVVFTSDHGEFLGDHGLLRKGPPPYRQLLQVPLLVAGPGVVPGGRRQMTSHVDLRRTLAAMVGVEAGPDDGQDFSAVLRDPAAAGRSHLHAEYHPRVDAETYNQTLITEDWRLTVYPNRPGWGEFFDRRADPGEHRNLWADAGLVPVRTAMAATLQQEFPAAPAAGGEVLAVY